MTDPDLYLTRMTVEFHPEGAGRARVVMLGDEPAIVLSFRNDPDNEDGIALQCQVSSVLPGADWSADISELTGMLRGLANYIDEAAKYGETTFTTKN